MSKQPKWEMDCGQAHWRCGECGYGTLFKTVEIEGINCVCGSCGQFYLQKGNTFEKIE